MRHIEIGTKLILKPLTRTETESELELESRLESEMPDNHILIDAPTHEGVLYPISIEEPLQVSFTYKDGICHFRCVAVERLAEGGFHYIRARIMPKVSHTQRRKYFRVKDAVKGKYTVWKHVDGEMHEFHSEYLSSDMSCGGMALYTKEACEVGENIMVSIPLGPQEGVAHLHAEVRWRQNEEVDSYHFLMGVRFCYSDPSERETVRKYVHQLQQKMIRKMRRNQ